MSFTDVWNEAYNLYTELADRGSANARKSTRDFLVCHALDGNILLGDVDIILDDVIETYNL